MCLRFLHMNMTKCILICIFLSHSTFSLAQLNCPFIWPIDGGVCGDCSPSGWDNILTADIVNGNSWFVCPLSGLGQSPTGGNSALLYGTSNNSEGISTLVGGLVPGNVYNIAFYWVQAFAECPGGLNFGGGNLNITIDGTLYEFSGADDWEIAELCYTAQSSVAEIILTIDSDDPGIILVDSAPCEDLMTCCELEVEVNNDATICPGEEFQFEGEYDYEQGAVTVEWISSPSEGVDFLNDRFILNPIFELPDDGEFLGEDYVFTLLINDVICERSDEFYLTVSPSIVPEFDFSICEVFEDFEFPTTSIEGYTGYWEGDFDYADLAGTNQLYTFFLDDGQDNCVESHTYEFFIEEAEPVMFELKGTYCGLDKDEYYLEFTSDNGVEGTWSPDAISPDRLTPDSYTIIFVPDPELHCAFNFEYEFEIREADSLTFSLPSAFCIIQDNYILPSVSNEGIQGDWEVDEIDVSTIGSNFQITFTPEEIEDCYYEYVHTYDVTNNITNTFDIPQSICENVGVYELPTTSNEGYEGLWAPPAFDFDTINATEIFSVWNPLPNQSQCLVNSPISILVEEATALQFSLVDTICKMDSDVVLPTADMNNITGAWDVPVVSPNALDPGVYYFEFTPEDIYCAQNYMYTVYIIEESEPTFNLVTGFCPSQSAVTLPTVSEDGITGSWSVPIIDPSIPNVNSIQSTFTPDPNQKKCLLPLEQTFTIDLLIDPQFNIPTQICSNVFPFTLPSRSINGIEGNWSIPLIDGSDSNLNYALTFTPDDLSCYNSLILNIDIVRLDLITVEKVDPSDCFSSDGSIIFNDMNQDIEYSIDSGLTWSSVSSFTNLPSGRYDILARSNTIANCERSFTLDLIDPDPVFFLNVDSINVSSCELQNGEIICSANLNDVEFSIDMGSSWQSQNSFENLEANTYTVMVRNASGPSCIDTTEINILDFPETLILEAIGEDLTECTIDNGSLIVNAVGAELEYSIDGINWQESNSFDNLPSGNIEVFARSSISHDCIDTTSVILLGVEQPEIDSVTIVNPTDCNIANGMITVYSTGFNLEYSIDMGINWQTSNVFDDLAVSSYTFMVRKAGTTTCFVEQGFSLTDPEQIILTDIIVQEPTNCFPQSGSVQILASHSLSGLEYSLDGGLTWQSEDSFENLSQGNYDLLIRPVLFPNCLYEEIVTVLERDEVIEITSQVINQPSDCVTDDASVQVFCNIADLEFSIDLGVNWQTNNLFENIPEGSYEMLIRKIGVADCSTTLDFEIVYPSCPCNDIDVDIDITNVNCLGANTGVADIVDVSGFYTDETYYIDWSNGVSSPLNDNLDSGWYTYNINYDLNCDWLDSVYIEPFDPITFGLLSFDKTCTDSAYLEVVDFMGGSGTFNFSIDGNVFQEDAVFYNVTPEDYQVIVMDQMNCQETENITLNSNLDLSLELEGIDPIFIGQSTVLNPLINQTSIDSFVWVPSYNVQNIGQLAIEVAPRETTEYTLTIYYGDCIETRSVVVEVIDNRTIYVANIFSLNNPNNDVLFIQGADDVEVEIEDLSIYDRWGNLVFKQNDIVLNDKSFGWDGYYNGKVAELGVYTYLINYKLRGEQTQNVGTITFIY